jgi:hypothetical protein
MKLSLHNFDILAPPNIALPNLQPIITLKHLLFLFHLVEQKIILGRVDQISKIISLKSQNSRAHFAQNNESMETDFNGKTWMNL